jgi:hypothetical protein
LVLKAETPHGMSRGAFLKMTLKIAGLRVKEASHSSTARPQEKCIEAKV